MQRRSNIERGHAYPSPPTSPDNGHALPAMGVKPEGTRYFGSPAWHFDAPLLPHLSTDNLLQPHPQQGQRWLKYRQQPIPERNHPQRIAPPSNGPWYVDSLRGPALRVNNRHAGIRSKNQRRNPSCHLSIRADLHWSSKT